MKKLYLFFLLFVALIGISYAEMNNPYSNYGGSAGGGSGSLPSGVEGQMLYNNAGTWTAFGGIFWDDGDNEVGVGESTPTAKLDIKDSTKDGSTDTLKLKDSDGVETLAVDSNGTITISGGVLVHRTPTAVDYNPSALTTDYIIAVTDTTAARVVTISTEDVQSGTTTKPRIFIIKDESGAAGINKITVSLESGNIDGIANYEINSNYADILLYCTGVNCFTFGN